MPVDRSSAAHIRFDAITKCNDPVAAIRALITSKPPTFEDDHLECKGGQEKKFGSTVPLPEDTVKEIWCEALAGFANLGGGVLIFGLDAPSKATGITGESLVADAHTFTADLIRLQRTSNEPPVRGVEIESYPVDGGKAGFVVCLIPESKTGPHDCQMIKNKPYRMRSGDSFVPIPPSLLRRLMYPQFSPELMFTGKGSIGLNREDYHSSIRVLLNVVNVGTGTAKDAYVIVEDVTDDKAASVPNSGDVNQREWSKPLMVESGGLAFHALQSLHPQQLSELFTIFWQREADGKVEVKQVIEPEFGYKVTAANIPPRVLKITAYAENMYPQTRTLTITAANLLKGETVICEEQ